MIVVGGAIGWVVAQRVQMTQMPQLLAMMQSLVGLAAVFIGFNTHIELVGVSKMDEGTRALLDRFAAVIAHLLNAGSAIIWLALWAVCLQSGSTMALKRGAWPKPSDGAAGIRGV